MIKTLAKSIGEAKKFSILTPILVSFEVVLECLIPFKIAELVNSYNSFGTETDFFDVLRPGIALVIMALLSLAFGALAGVTASRASCLFAKNLRRDMFYGIQDFSFENIDRFSTSSLVTRLTTDVANVQMAYMMIIRVSRYPSYHRRCQRSDGVYDDN